jgi:hypothetical protein
VPNVPHDDLDDRIRRAYVRPVDEDVAARHLAAIAAAARDAEGSSKTSAPGRRRRPFLRPVLATGLALVALPAGLAVAGVDLPDAIDRPYDVIGVELPNQGSGADAPATAPAAPATPAREDEGDDTTPLEPATTTEDESPAREKAGDEDDAAANPGRRRSDTRSKGRRGEEASEGRRQGAGPASGAEKATPARRSTERSHGRQGAATRTTPPAAAKPRGKAVAGEKRARPQKAPAEPREKAQGSPPADPGPNPQSDEKRTPPGRS